MDLRRILKSGAAAICIVAVAVPQGYAVTPVPTPRGVLDVRHAQASDFSRIEFHWAGASGYTMRRAGQVVTLRFSRDANPDIAELRAMPPRFVRTVTPRHDGGVLSVDFTLADGVDARVGQADGAIFLNVFARADAPTDAAMAPSAGAAIASTQVTDPDQAAAQARARAARPNPVPADGVVHVQAASVGPQLTLQFPWRAPVGAAVFRRGDAVWIIFDAAARFDLAALPRGVSTYVSATPVQGEGYSGVRLTTSGPMAIAAQDTGTGWTVNLGAGNPPSASVIPISRADADGPVSVQAQVSGTTGVFWIDDPVVGDRMAVVTALGPAKALPQERNFLQFALLATAQGLAVTPVADGMNVDFAGDLVTISRQGGLLLSARDAGVRGGAGENDRLRPATLPTLIADDWTVTSSTQFRPTYERLLAALAAEQTGPQRSSSSARMTLARFLVGQQLSYEAIGLLNNGLRRNPSLGSDAEFRGLRGIANVMARRYAEAGADFASPALANDPGAAAWRGYVAAQGGQWEDAHRQFETGRTVFSQFSPLWRGRFGQSAANAALAVGDNASARTWVAFALASGQTPSEQIVTRLIQARLMEASGERDRALAVYQALMAAPTDAVAAPATLRATQIRLDKGQITPAQAEQIFAPLRYRWRGDGFELDVIRTLGQLYLSQGHYREALETFRSAGNRLPNLPQSVQLQADLNSAFRAMFIDGLADGLEPIQALALFYDFRDLTPVGADGDLMVRRLVRRLVDVDLLNQAETLLRYQVENRLDGAAKAQVATDLAVIYLMDRRPEDALAMINNTRTTILPLALNLQRRIVTARALEGLGRYDAALEMLGTDISSEAQDVRATIAWRQRAWPAAGTAYERALGERWRTPTTPLSLDEEGKLLRAAVAFSLGGDEASLNRLRERYQGFQTTVRNPDALRVALSGANGGPISAAEFGRVTADNTAFQGWVNRMKVRFRQLASEPVPPRALRAAVAAPAPAATPTPAPAGRVAANPPSPAARPAARTG